MNLRQIVPLATAALLIAGCAHAGDGVITATAPLSPSASSPDLRPTPDTTDLTAVDTASPDAVALAVVGILNQYDTRTDLSPAAAARRAAPLLTPALAAALTKGSTRTDSTWLYLERHAGHTAVTTHLANEHGQPANTDTDAYAQVSVTVTPSGSDGWVGNTTSSIARVTLQRVDSSAPWLVSGFPS